MTAPVRFLLLLAIPAWACSSASKAAPGDLDSSFGVGGKVTTPVGAAHDRAYSVAVQADGKIVVAGESSNGSSGYDFALARYTAGGVLDTTFNTTGKVVTGIGVSDDHARVVAVQADGKIIVAGYSSNGTSGNSFALARYYGTGGLDTTFGNGTGKVIQGVAGTNGSSGAANGVALQPDGKIVAAGSAGGDFAVARFTDNGTPDASFNSSGVVNTDIGTMSDSAKAVLVQADGKIVAAGSAADDFVLVRYKSDGALDASFGSGGKTRTLLRGGGGGAMAVALLPDGKLLVAGYSTKGDGTTQFDFALARYLSDGTLDATFGSGGIVFTDIAGLDDVAYALAVQGDGRIVLAGRSHSGVNNDFALIRYNANGALDATFHSDGKVTSPIGQSQDYGYALAIQSDKKLVVAGYAGSNLDNDFALARYEAGPFAPVIITGAASAVTITGATLSATVTAYDAAASVRFEYGLTTSYGSTVTASPATVAGLEPTPVSATISGLARGSTYHFRATAQDANGTVVGDDVTFATTPNTAPAPGTVSVTVMSGGSAAIDVLSAATDVDGDALAIESVSGAAHGSVTITGGSISFTPEAGFSGGDSFSYTIVDGFGGRSPATVAITVQPRPTSPVAAIGAASGELIPGAGISGAGAEALPTGSRWASFGVPAINDGGQLAFTATVKAGTATFAAVFTGTPASPVLVAKKGDPLPGDTTGVTFASFTDPVIDGAGAVAFLATVAGAGVGGGNRQVLCTTAYGELAVIARSGAQPPGVKTGAKWSSLQTAALPDGVIGPVFVAKMAVSPAAGVNAANDLGLWAMDSARTLRLLARKGDSVQGKVLKNLFVLGVVPAASGQTRSFNRAGEIVYRAYFGDGSQGLVTVTVP